MEELIIKSKQLQEEAIVYATNVLLHNDDSDINDRIQAGINAELDESNIDKLFISVSNMIQSFEFVIFLRNNESGITSSLDKNMNLSDIYPDLIMFEMDKLVMMMYNYIKTTDVDPSNELLSYIKKQTYTDDDINNIIPDSANIFDDINPSLLVPGNVIPESELPKTFKKKREDLN